VQDETTLRPAVRALVHTARHGRTCGFCARPDGHIQATGRDARGRKQYRYHPALPGALRNGEVRAPRRVRSRGCRGVRKQVATDPRAQRPAARAGSSATVVQLLELTIAQSRERGVRPVEQVVRSHDPAQNRHARFERGAVRFPFLSAARAGSSTRFRSRMPPCAGRLRRCQDLPGQLPLPVRSTTAAFIRSSSNDVNEYPAQHTAEMDHHGQGVPYVGWGTLPRRV